jgi:hypothetical protein
MPTAAIDATVWFGSDGSVSISAAPDSLKALGHLLSAQADTVIELTPSTPGPEYVAAAESIRVCIEREPGITISRDADELVVRGHTEGLAILAKNITHLGTDPTGLGPHIHIEYFPGHFYVRAGSIPLVVGIT